MQNIWVVIPAAGKGQRFGGQTSKQYLPLGGLKVIQQTLNRLDAAYAWAGIVVALHSQDEQAQTLTYQVRAPIEWVRGGAERVDSVRAGLQALQKKAAPDDWVLVHDVARPCVQVQSIQHLIHVLADNPVGGLLAMPVRDTLKKANGRQQVDYTLDRHMLWQAQTPQMFRYGLLQEALHSAIGEAAAITDEASAMERAGHAVQLVEGRADNLKITFPEDLALAELILNLVK